MRVCLDTEGKVAFFTPAGRAVFDAPRGGLPRRPTTSATPTPLAPTPLTPLPPAPPTAAYAGTAEAYAGAAAAYPGAARWPHDGDIPWDIEARAMEALDV